MAISLDEVLGTAPRGLSFQAALEAILDTAPALPPQTLPLDQAQGRTLAQPIVALRDQPPTPVSAMDGYAVRAADLPHAPLTIDGETAAGDPVAPPLPLLTARRVFTGAPLPPGADAVLRQEDAKLDGEGLSATMVLGPGTFVRPQGFDFARGQGLLPAGQIIDARALALAAAANQSSLCLVRRPKIHILSTGAELKPPGQAHAPEHVVANNGLMLASLLTEGGAKATDCGFVGDRAEAIAGALLQARSGADLLLTTGGASVGDHDLVQAALHSLGARPQFWQVMMRPGKPVFLWDWDGLPVLGLPGNPVSAYVCARMLALPWARKALGQGIITEPHQTLPLAGPLRANGPRHQFARAVKGPDGLTPAPSQDSSLIHTLHLADALIERPPHEGAKNVGENVQAILL